MWWEEGRAGDGVGKGPARSHLLAWVTNCQQWLPVPSIFRASWLGRWVVTHSLANRTSTATSQVLLMKALTPLASWAIKWLRRWPTRESHFQMISSGMGKLPNYNGGAIQGLCERDSLSSVVFKMLRMEDQEQLSFCDLSRREYVWDSRQHGSIWDKLRETWWHHLSPMC